jgi:hypothetical protein
VNNTKSARHSFNESSRSDTHLQRPAKRLRINSLSRTELSSKDHELATEALQKQNETYLPPLRSLPNHVVLILSSDECLKHFVYCKHQIARHSSSRILANIISAIDTTTCILEAQIIGRHTLQRIKEIQKADYPLFDCDSGYLKFRQIFEATNTSKCTAVKHKFSRIA